MLRLPVFLLFRTVYLYPHTPDPSFPTPTSGPPSFLVTCLIAFISAPLVLVSVRHIYPILSHVWASVDRRCFHPPRPCNTELQYSTLQLEWGADITFVCMTPSSKSANPTYKFDNYLISLSFDVSIFKKGQCSYLPSWDHVNN